MLHVSLITSLAHLTVGFICEYVRRRGSLVIRALERPAIDSEDLFSFSLLLQFL
jgi:hypothetical protein